MVAEGGKTFYIKMLYILTKVCYVHVEVIMKIMGIDYGEARIGIALSDLLKMLASPYEVYYVKGEVDYQYFLDIIQRESVDTLVVGLPYNMKGEEQEIAEKAKKFANTLAEKSGCKLVMVDERMSSVVAEEILRQKYRDWRDRKRELDKFSAMVILQDYLDTL